MSRNLAILTDAYKVSHYRMYPKGTEEMSFYFESRGGRWNRSLFFGLQYYLKTLYSKKVTKSDVQEADSFWTAVLGPDVFNRKGWDYIVDHCGGYLPIKIEAVEEGTVLPTSNVLFQVKNTDPNTFWLPGWLETTISQTWYPTTVATLSYVCKKIILNALEKTGTPELLPFKLHDFGFRGTSSIESAGIGAMAHLMNFKGTDTSIGSVFAKQYYNAEDDCGLSIPASDHSCITSWGREHEGDAYENVLDEYLKTGSIVACVSDAYDIYSAVEHLWGERFNKRIVESGGTLVVRPDSGNPVNVVCTVINKLMDKFGYSVNEKGYKVLPEYIRVIQGDGVDENSIKDILFEMEIQKLSADNVAFGMGSCLLQNLNRDTLCFAMKCSSITVNGKTRDVYKAPVTDTWKTSKRGELALIESKGAWKTVRKTDLEESGFENKLVNVFENGQILKEYTQEDILNKIN